MHTSNPGLPLIPQTSLPLVLAQYLLLSICFFLVGSGCKSTHDKNSSVGSASKFASQDLASLRQEDILSDPKGYYLSLLARSQKAVQAGGNAWDFPYPEFRFILNQLLRDLKAKTKRDSPWLLSHQEISGSSKLYASGIRSEWSHDGKKRLVEHIDWLESDTGWRDEWKTNLEKVTYNQAIELICKALYAASGFAEKIPSETNIAPDMQMIQTIMSARGRMDGSFLMLWNRDTSTEDISRLAAVPLFVVEIQTDLKIADGTYEGPLNFLRHDFTHVNRTLYGGNGWERYKEESGFMQDPQAIPEKTATRLVKGSVFFTEKIIADFDLRAGPITYPDKQAKLFWAYLADEYHEKFRIKKISEAKLFSEEKWKEQFWGHIPRSNPPQFILSRKDLKEYEFAAEELSKFVHLKAQGW